MDGNIDEPIAPISERQWWDRLYNSVDPYNKTSIKGLNISSPLSYEQLSEMNVTDSKYLSAGSTTGREVGEDFLKNLRSEAEKDLTKAVTDSEKKELEEKIQKISTDLALRYNEVPREPILPPVNPIVQNDAEEGQPIIDHSAQAQSSITNNRRAGQRAGLGRTYNNTGPTVLEVILAWTVAALTGPVLTSQERLLDDKSIANNFLSKAPAGVVSKIDSIIKNIYKKQDILNRTTRSNSDTLDEKLYSLSEAQANIEINSYNSNQAQLRTIYKNHDNHIFEEYTMFTENDTKTLKMNLSFDASNIYSHKSGLPVHMSIMNDIDYSIYANRIENKILDYHATNNFLNPFFRHVKSKHIKLFSDSTSHAFKSLSSISGFELIFNPSRLNPVLSDNAENIGIQYDGSFIGGEENINLSPEWWKYHNIQDVSKIFNNKYLQYYSLVHSFKKPTTSCASFCNLLGTDHNSQDQSFNELATMYDNVCYKAQYKDKHLTCNLCRDDESCSDYSPESCKKSTGEYNLSFIKMCPKTCNIITKCAGNEAYYIADDNSYVGIECHNITKPSDAESCAKTCGICNNILKTCNCVAKTPTPLKSIYQGRSPVNYDYSLKTYLSTTWQAQGKNVWWHKQTGNLPSCTCTYSSDEEIKASCKLCGKYYISDCCGVLTDGRAVNDTPEISNNLFLIANHYYTNNFGKEELGGPYYNCIFDASKTFQGQRHLISCNDGANIIKDKRWDNNCIRNYSGEPVISYNFINVAKTNTLSNLLIHAPSNCNQFCLMKSLLLNNEYGLTKSLTPYGTESNNLSVCRCTTRPTNCQACINSYTDDGKPITDCDTYCKTLYPGENQRLNFVITGECGNSSGTSIDSKTNCCNCYIYDTTKRQSRLLLEHKKSECSKCGNLGGRVTDCSTLNISGGYQCIDFHTKSSNELTYQCRNDYIKKDGTMKCKKHTVSCDNSSNYLRGCYNTITQESPPTNYIFNSKYISKYASSDSSIYKNQHSCKSNDPNKLTSTHCEYFCNPNTKPYISEISCSICDCSYVDKTYSELRTCYGLPMPHISGPDFDCSFTYKGAFLLNSLNLGGYFVKEPDNSFGFRQCLITANGNVVASKNSCKVPKRVDDVELPILPQGTSVFSQADYLHHYCNSSYDDTGTKSCKIETLDWTSKTFAKDTKSLGYIDRPIDVIYTLGHRGSQCISLPQRQDINIPIQGVCAKNISHAFRPDEEGTITCNIRDDCSGYKDIWDGSYDCYRQGGYYCSSGNINTREEMCKTSYKNRSTIITHHNNDITINCPDPSSIMLSCSESSPSYSSHNSSLYVSSPDNSFNNNDFIDDCCGSTWYHTTGNSYGLNKYLNAKILNGLEDDCISLTPNMINQPGIQDGSVCPGYYKVNENLTGDYGATGIQCVWNKESNKCRISIDSTINTVQYCRAVPKYPCNLSFYSASYSHLSDDTSLCNLIHTYPLPDCSYASPKLNFDGSFHSYCLGYTLSGGTPYQCMYNNDLSKCDISQSNMLQVCLPIKNKTYLGYSDSPDICKEAKAVKTNKGLRCLAYYSLPDIKPRAYTFNSTLLSLRCQVPAIAKWDLSVGSTKDMGKGYNSADFNRLNELCSKDKTCNSYMQWAGENWGGYIKNMNYKCVYMASGDEPPRCRLTNKASKCFHPAVSSEYVDVIPYNDKDNDTWIDYFTINNKYYNNITHTIDFSGINSSANIKTRNDCANVCTYEPTCQGFLFSPNTKLCKLHTDNSLNILKYGYPTINITYEKNTLNASYYSKYPTIWVSKEVAYSYEPYHYSLDTPGAPYHTGQTCNELPDENGMCLPKKSSIIRDHFCKTEHPLDYLERTSIIASPTPVPLTNEYMFNDLSFTYNLIPYVSQMGTDGKQSSWPTNECVKASIENTILGNYDFDNIEDCTDAKTLDTETSCTRSWGERCESPMWIDNNQICSPGQSNYTAPVNDVYSCSGEDPTVGAQQCVYIYNSNGYGQGKLTTDMVKCVNGMCQAEDLYSKDIKASSFSSCATGHMCYATDNYNRDNGKPLIECNNASPPPPGEGSIKCRCLPMTGTTYGTSFSPDSSNMSIYTESIDCCGTIDCNTYCNEGFGTGGVQGSKCHYMYDTNNQKHKCNQQVYCEDLISYTTTTKYRCKCIRNKPWVNSLDDMITRTPPNTSQKGIGREVEGGAGQEEPCGRGLMSYPVHALNSPNNIVRDSNDYICLPNYNIDIQNSSSHEKKSITFPDMMSYKSYPPERHDTTLTPLLHQGSCGTGGVYSSPSLYNKTTHICCAGTINELKYNNYTKCCGSTVIDYRYSYCVNNQPKNNLLIDDVNKGKQFVDCSYNIQWDLKHGYYFNQVEYNNGMFKCN